MKITEKELRKIIREAVHKKLQEAVTDKKKEPSAEWVKFIADVDSLVKETIDKAKDLVERAEEIQSKEIENEDGSGFIKDRKVKEYQVVDQRKHFVKNLITKLSSVDFDMSQTYYRGKV